MFSTLGVGALAAGICASVASAQITEQDDVAFGAGSVTRDSAQNLDFLDVSLSAGQTPASVMAEFVPGGAFEGWRYATVLEVATLINNWGFSPGAPTTGGVVDAPSGVDELSGLVALLGPTTSVNGFSSVVGITGTNGSSADFRVLYRINDEPLAFNDGAGPDGQLFVQSGAAAFGHYLVREVPAPSAVALFGVAGLAALRRRR